MGRLFRFVVSGASVAELKDNMTKALNELNGEENMASPEPTSRTATVEVSNPIQIPHIPALPVTSPAQVEVPTSTGVDSMGLPWDERIHSANMGKSKDGSWRLRRGVEPAFVKQVEHELISKIKSGGAAEAPTFQAPAPSPALPPLQPSAPVIPFSPVPMGNVPPPAPSIAQVPVVQPPMAAPIAPSIVTPVAPQPLQVTSAHTLETFTQQFVPTLSHLVAEGKLTQEYVAALKNYFKLEQIFDATAAQIAEMFETFCKAGLLTKVG